VHGRTDRYQQKVNGCLHGCPHTDNGEGVVQLYQEVTDYTVKQKA